VSGRPDCRRETPACAAAAALLAAGLSVAALLSGCGGSSARTGAGTAAARLRHNLPGARGERIGAEAATSQHLSRSDCAALRRRSEAQTGSRLALHSEPTPPSSRCRLTGTGAAIGVYLDSGRSAHQRYLNRMVEQDQFGAPDPSRITHPVPKVGDPAPGHQNANWVPGLGSLFASRGNRWLTVAYSVGGVALVQARDRAAVLARLGFRLSAR
jgi:hypothetical protein